MNTFTKIKAVFGISVILAFFGFILSQIPSKRWTKRWGTSLDHKNLPPSRPVDYVSMDRDSRQLQKIRDYEW